jgi:hypothetical protein
MQGSTILSQMPTSLNNWSKETTKDSMRKVAASGSSYASVNRRFFPESLTGYQSPLSLDEGFKDTTFPAKLLYDSALPSLPLNQNQVRHMQVSYWCLFGVDDF